MHIEALATCYNRVDKTLSSISNLVEQKLPKGITLSINIIDDGSTDGTFDMIKDNFPFVNILRTNGELFWAGGMRFGWEQCIKNKSFDALLVFNDDININDDALLTMIDTMNMAKKVINNNLYVVAGAFSSLDNKTVTYGGFRRSSSWHKLRFKKIFPSGEYESVDTLNMNLALISKESLSKIGFLSKIFKHGGADMDFGLRLKNNGGVVLLTSKFVGTCDLNSKKGTSQESGISYFERLKRLISIKEQPIKQRFFYYKAHAGRYWLILFLLPYIRVILTGKNNAV